MAWSELMSSASFATSHFYFQHKFLVQRASLLSWGENSDGLKLSAALCLNKRLHPPQLQIQSTTLQSN